MFAPFLRRGEVGLNQARISAHPIIPRMKRTAELNMSDAKAEAIAAIRRLKPSASETFLNDFSERQLQAFLARLEEAQAWRERGPKTFILSSC